MQKGHSVLENLTKPAVVEPADSAESVRTDVPSSTTTPVQPSRSTPPSTLRDIGKDIPQTEKTHSLWTAYILSCARAADDWGDADFPEVFTDSLHPRAVAAKDFLWNKRGSTIQRQILQDDIKTAAALWTYFKTEVSEAACQSLVSLQRALFNATLLQDESIAE